jgi:hypothetical protein
MEAYFPAARKVLSQFTGVYDYRRGVDWILDLLTQLGSTSNYSAIADFHTLKISSTR